MKKISSNVIECETFKKFLFGLFSWLIFFNFSRRYIIVVKDKESSQRFGCTKLGMRNVTLKLVFLKVICPWKNPFRYLEVLGRNMPVSLTEVYIFGGERLVACWFFCWSGNNKISAWFSDSIFFLFRVWCFMSYKEANTFVH